MGPRLARVDPDSGGVVAYGGVGPCLETALNCGTWVQDGGSNAMTLPVAMPRN
jgi:hypothetical protein